MLNKLNGINILTIPDKFLPGGDYIQVKSHKKKRINKKYLKKYGKKYQAPMQIYAFANGFYCPESRLKTIIKKLQSDKSLQDTLNIMMSKPFADLQTKSEREKYLQENVIEGNKEEKIREMSFLNLSPC